ncbi:MAG: hypothetical protein KDJ19_12175 [Hyphomicrobiaceae bacterium]|nr:hypothetical protein [Hyphomicrobiaceae bacterium]MCC0022936.1 hypothetical protein [Hyphomicrobiaceae bacterium]
MDQTEAPFADILAFSDGLFTRDDAALADFGEAEALALLDSGEAILEAWLEAHDQVPTDKKVEGFRLLALHKQAARGNPSFNACRETCRELVYHYNLIVLEPSDVDRGQRIRLAAMVLKHLALFVGGKLEESGLGDFCCSSRPIRQTELLDPHQNV